MKSILQVKKYRYRYIDIRIPFVSANVNDVLPFFTCLDINMNTSELAQLLRYVSQVLKM